jgi:hypothetical protein
MTKVFRLVAAALCLGCTGIVEQTFEETKAEPTPGAPVTEDITGTLVRTIVGGADGTSSSPEYFVETADGDWIRLHFDRRPDLYHPHAAGEEHDGHDGPPVGAGVRVLGQRDAEQRLQVLQLRILQRPAPEVEAITQALIAPSARKVAVILANFANNTAQPLTPDATRTLVFTGTSSSNAYFKEVSFGVRSLVGKLRPDGDVFGWYTIANNNSPCDYSAWGTAARAAAQSAGVDLSGYDHIVHYFPKSSSCGWSGVGQVPGRYTWVNGSSASTIAHELGHNFGLHHASSLSCTQDGTRVSISASCTVGEYGDPFDVMGSGYRHLCAYHKGRLGWLEPENMVTATADGSFTVVPIEQKSTGIQSLRVKIDSTRFYYIELRQPFGFDNFAATAPVVNGVLIHRGTEYTSMTRPELVDMTPGTTSFSDAALGAGKTFTDAASGISIAVVAVSSSGATVTVDLPGGGACTPTTCAALGAACGTPSNGCGGTLSCGSCGAGQTCNASFQCANTPVGGGPQTAVYDGTLKAPKCGAVGSSCDSGASLLNGRANLGPEPNRPNTINGACADGTSGSYHADESIDRIKVTAVDGTDLAAGKTVRIEATVWVWGVNQDRLDLYYTASAGTPSWTLVGTLTPTATGVQTLTATYVLPAGALQAVRANFRYQGSASPCTPGEYNDHDDLIFAVR